LRKFENHVQYIKYSVLKEVAKSKYNNTLEKDLLDIPEKIIEGEEAVTRCCVYKERAIIKERVKLALGGNKDNPNLIEVLNIACDDCHINKYIVTDACRGCLAHKCVTSCKFDAIDIVNQKSQINTDKCKECGQCVKNCPYNAIVEVKRPCIKSCEAGAIIIDPETKLASIDYEKCVQCGSCVYQCPFGAIMDKSYILDVIDLLSESNNNKDYKVYAIIAPAISSQFTYAKIEQVITGIKKLGFHSVVEAALGADIIANYEAKQVVKELDELDFITTSCCPAFVEYIKKEYPKLVPNVSNAVSPMIATARLIKQTDPDAKIVFIGPCIGKKEEARKDEFKNDIDYVITFEELQAFLDAKEIKVEECEEGVLDNASYFGRIFARSGGVTEAIKHVATNEEFDKEIEPVVCDGLEECKKALTMANLNRLKGNFIEGMACKGGCISGPASLSHGVRDKREVDNYANLSLEKNIKNSIRVLNTGELNLDVR
jgi:[FeFe] hydrogenase (group B1/B3)